MRNYRRVKELIVNNWMNKVISNIQITVSLLQIIYCKLNTAILCPTTLRNPILCIARRSSTNIRNLPHLKTYRTVPNYPISTPKQHHKWAHMITINTQIWCRTMRTDLKTCKLDLRDQKSNLKIHWSRCIDRK